MIVIVSSVTREATVLAALCEHRNWPCHPCSTVGRFMTLNEQLEPRALVVRHRLNDGYSDDVFSFLKTASTSNCPRVIVLMSADSTGKAEARQIELGADCVLRDPVRIEVLLEYLAKYRTMKEAPGDILSSQRPSYKVAEVEVLPHEHRIGYAGQTIHVAPQEIALLRLLARSHGKVVTYSLLYDELFNRKFEGDTTNSRVLLGKLCASFKQLGVDLKSFVQVIPKSGYLYSVPPNSTPMQEKARPSKKRTDKWQRPG